MFAACSAAEITTYAAMPPDGAGLLPALLRAATGGLPVQDRCLATLAPWVSVLVTVSGPAPPLRQLLAMAPTHCHYTPMPSPARPCPLHCSRRPARDCQHA